MGRVIGALLLTVLLLTGCAREEPLSGSQPEPSAQSSSQSGPAAEEPSSQPESLLRYRDCGGGSHRHEQYHGFCGGLQYDGGAGEL